MENVKVSEYNNFIMQAISIKTFDTKSFKRRGFYEKIHK